jgi:hypothetical protein
MVMATGSARPRPGFVLACASLATLVACGGGSSPGTPTSPSAPAPTPPVVPVTAVLVGAGDIGLCGGEGPKQTAAIIDGIDGTVTAVGDIAYMDGTAEQFLKCYDPTWGRHKNRTRPVPGNHDYMSAGAAPYYAYFGDRAGPPGLGYYSYQAGAWLVLAMNSNIPIGNGSAQLEWARSELRNTSSQCVAVYVHHPRFSSGPNGNSDNVRDLWTLLYEYKVEFVVSGHDHLYERYAPQDAAGRLDLDKGVRMFVAGTGGHDIYAVTRVQANSEVRYSGWGVLKFTLASDRYTWDFIAVPGQSFTDMGTTTCH